MEDIVRNLLENHYFSRWSLDQLIVKTPQGQLVTQNPQAFNEYTAFVKDAIARLFGQTKIQLKSAPAPASDVPALVPKVVLLANDLFVKQICNAISSDSPSSEQLQQMADAYLTNPDHQKFLNDTIHLVFGEAAYSIFAQAYKSMHLSSFAVTLIVGK